MTSQNAFLSTWGQNNTGSYGRFRNNRIYLANGRVLREIEENKICFSCDFTSDETKTRKKGLFECQLCEKIAFSPDLLTFAPKFVFPAYRCTHTFLESDIALYIVRTGTPRKK